MVKLNANAPLGFRSLFLSRTMESLVSIFSRTPPTDYKYKPSSPWHAVAQTLAYFLLAVAEHTSNFPHPKRHTYAISVLSVT